MVEPSHLGKPRGFTLGNAVAQLGFNGLGEFTKRFRTHASGHASASSNTCPSDRLVAIPQRTSCYGAGADIRCSRMT